MCSHTGSLQHILLCRWTDMTDGHQSTIALPTLETALNIKNMLHDIKPFDFPFRQYEL